MYYLKLFGAVSLTSDGVPLTGPAAQRRRLALLAVLAGGPEVGVSREKLIGYIWPDIESDQARRFLADSVYALRRALAQEAILAAGDNLQLNAEVIGCDVVGFRKALAGREWEAATSLYEGPFLDGFYVPDAPEFGMWADVERAELARRHADALEQLARDAEALGEHARAAQWWRGLQNADPLNSRVALRLVSALKASGDRAAALQHVRIHEMLLHTELDLPPDPAMVSFAERLRSPTPPTATPSEPATQAAPREQNLLTATPTPVTAVGPAQSRAMFGRRRKQIALAAALLLVITVIGDVAVGRWLRHPANQRVVVLSFENRTGQRSYDPLGLMAADWIARGLLQTGTLEVVSPTWTSYTPTGDKPQIAAIAEDTGAGTLVAGAYYLDGERLRFEAQVVDLSRGKVLQAPEPIAVAIDSATAGVELLRQRVMTALAARFVASQELREITARPQPPTYSAYGEYLQGVQLFSRFQSDKAASHFERAWSLDTTFHLARVYSALAALNAGKIAKGDSLVKSLAPERDRMAPFDRVLLDACEARLAGNKLGVLRSMRRISTMTPGSQFVVGHAVAAISSNRPREALTTLERIDPNVGLLRDNPRYWEWLTVARHLLGHHREELQDARRGRAQHSDVHGALAQQIRALAALGRVKDVDRLLEEFQALPAQSSTNAADIMRVAAEELRAHGNSDVAQRFLEKAIAWYESRPVQERARHEPALALTLYEAGQWEEARTIFERLAAAEPNNVSHLGHLGVLAARRRDFSEVERVAAALASSKQPYLRGRQTLWRARIAAQLGHSARAVDVLRESFAQGTAHGIWLHTDPDLQPLRHDLSFIELVRPEH